MQIKYLELERELLSLGLNIQDCAMLFLVIVGEKPSLLFISRNTLSAKKMLKRYRLKFRNSRPNFFVASRNKKNVSRLYAADSSKKGHFDFKNAIVLGKCFGYPDDSVAEFASGKHDFLSWEELQTIDPLMEYCFGISYKVCRKGPNDIEIGKLRILFLRKHAPRIYKEFRKAILLAMKGDLVEN